VWDALPPNTLLLVASAHGDLGEADRLRVRLSCGGSVVVVVPQPLKNCTLQPLVKFRDSQ